MRHLPRVALVGATATILVGLGPAVAMADLSVTGVVPTVTTPAVSVPAVTVPPVSVPAVTVPPVSTPVVTTPPISTPAVTTPSVTTPSVTTPSVSAPTVSAPTGGTGPVTGAVSAATTAAGGTARQGTGSTSNGSSRSGSSRSGSSGGSGSSSGSGGSGSPAGSAGDGDASTGSAGATDGGRAATAGGSAVTPARATTGRGAPQGAVLAFSSLRGASLPGGSKDVGEYLLGLVHDDLCAALGSMLGPLPPRIDGLPASVVRALPAEVRNVVPTNVLRNATVRCEPTQFDASIAHAEPDTRMLALLAQTGLMVMTVLQVGLGLLCIGALVRHQARRTTAVAPAAVN